MIRVKMSSKQMGIKDQILRKIGAKRHTAAYKSAHALADLIRANIASGYEMLLGGDKWPEIGENYHDKVGSTPGQVRTGKLIRSVEVKEVGDGKFEVVVNDPKAVWLEYGGFAMRVKEGDLVPPRPFFRPAVHYFEHHKIANTMMLEEIQDEL